MDLFDIAIARKLSGGGGGGGDSDFSIAQVTITGYNGATAFYPLYIPIIDNNRIDMIITGDLQEENSRTYLVPLYKGKMIVSTYDTIMDTSGAVTVDENNVVTITGDCAVTIRPE